ncbi:MAG: calcium-binding protein [Hyphomicrobiaceae bacterium]
MAIKRGTNARNKLIGTSAADQIFGLGGNDDLFGRNGNDKLFGGSGNDRLFGEAGNDLLDGGPGGDVMKGGKGNDTYVVNTLADQVLELAGQGNDTIRSSITLSLSTNSHIEHLVLTGSAAINGTLLSPVTAIGNSITGNGAANTLTGGFGHDVLVGGRGADTLNGGDGNDTLLPGAGAGVADIINGGDGFDTVDYRDALGPVELSLRTLSPEAPKLHAVGDVYISIENVVGSRFADFLQPSDTDHSFAFGGAGDDTLRANSTAHYDRLRGDDGYDTLIGNTGTEDFVLQYNRGMDVVFNFSPSDQDHILLNHSEFNLALSGGTRSVLDGTEFVSVAKLQDYQGSAVLIYSELTDILYADKDGAGSAFQPLAIAHFAGASNPAAGDIWLI